jgi:hypothetical protein
VNISKGVNNMETFTSTIIKETYFEPMVGEFNIYPFQGGVSSMNDIDTNQVFDEYLRRFEEAWKELAKY